MSHGPFECVNLKPGVDEPAFWRLIYEVAIVQTSPDPCECTEDISRAKHLDREREREHEKHIQVFLRHDPEQRQSLNVPVRHEPKRSRKN